MDGLAWVERVATRSKLELAYGTIKQRIFDGTYAPGHRLVLDRIAGELAVSVVPVREAVRRLEAEGHVEFERNVGARVARFDTDQYVPSMHVLALLEGYAAALAAPHLRRQDIARARRINRRMRAAVGDPLRHTALNHELHFVIYERCPNRHVRSLVEVEWARLDAIRRSDFIFVPADRAKDSADEHEELLSLLEAGADPDRIETAARDHKLRTVKAFIASRARAPAGAVTGAPPGAPARQSAPGGSA
jgi:DNA-binding GntR family transcriptional regulator